MLTQHRQTLYLIFFVTKTTLGRVHVEIIFLECKFDIKHDSLSSLCHINLFLFPKKMLISDAIDDSITLYWSIVVSHPPHSVTSFLNCLSFQSYEINNKK